MNSKNHVGRRVPPESASLAVLFGVLGALAMGDRTEAQTAPYQYSGRGSIGSGLGQSGLPQGGVFQPRVEAAVQYASNTGLAGEGEERTESAGLELSPGLYASYSVGSIVAAIDYSLIGRAWDDSDANDVSHRLSANGQWQAIPEWFSLVGQATYGDSILDPRQGLNYGGRGIFGSSNLAEVATASGGPVIQHRFKSFQVLAQYSYGRTWYLDEGKGESPTGINLGRDAIDQSANFSIGTAVPDSRVSGRVFYNWQDSEFENQFPYRYERAGFDGALQVTRTLSLVGDVGRESDLQFSTTEGGLDEDFWSAGLRWAPNERSSAEARYGERFFGDSYLLELNHSARLLEFSATYSEHRAQRLDPGVDGGGGGSRLRGRRRRSPAPGRRAANSTKQIEVLVRTIQADTNEAVVSMERTTTDVVGGALLAENAGAALEEIEQVSNQIASLVQNISASSRQQAGVSQSISRNMQVLREISSQTAESTTATSASIGKLAELAAQLRKLVTGFRLPGPLPVTGEFQALRPDESPPVPDAAAGSGRRTRAATCAASAAWRADAGGVAA